MKIKIYQLIYINYFIFNLNFFKKIKLHLIKKENEKLIFLKHIVSLRSNELVSYEIENEGNDEELVVSNKIPYLDMNNIEKLEQEVSRFLKNKKENKGKVELSENFDNVVCIDKWRKKR